MILSPNILPVSLQSIIVRKSAEFHVPSDWVSAQVLHESAGGNIFAYRPEPGFLKRYGDTIQSYIEDIDNPFTNYIWKTDAQAFASSYGLMQIMWSTAYEMGFRKPFPGELYSPDVNLHFGLKYLRLKIDDANGDLGLALDAYNDGRLNTRDADGNIVDDDYTSLIVAKYQEIYPDRDHSIPMLNGN